MALSMGSLQRLQLAQVDEAAKLAAAAFVHSPSYAYIYESLNEEQRIAALTWLFTVNIRLRCGHGCGRCAFAKAATGDERPKMLCFFMIQPPSVTDIGTLTMLANGMLLFPFRFGWRALVRLLQVKAYHERVDQAVRKKCTGPTAHLERMVVHPSAQGSGIGTRCLSIALTEAADAGHTVVLSTQSERNVKFYRRLGFEEADRDTGYFKTASSSGETNWTMIRRPAQTVDTALTRSTSSSSTGAGSGACLLSLVVAVGVVFTLLSHPPDPVLAADTKPFTSFDQFYPLYLEQHSQPMCEAAVSCIFQ
eukprot:SAG11_NODE_3406_length_2466_cov_2.904098_2_plen_307_part_00